MRNLFKNSFFVILAVILITIIFVKRGKALAPPFVAGHLVSAFSEEPIKLPLRPKMIKSIKELGMNVFSLIGKEQEVEAIQSHSTEATIDGTRIICGFDADKDDASITIESGVGLTFKYHQAHATPRDAYQIVLNRKNGELFKNSDVLQQPLITVGKIGKIFILVVSDACYTYLYDENFDNFYHLPDSGAGWIILSKKAASDRYGYLQDAFEWEKVSPATVAAKVDPAVDAFLARSY